jgi:DNA-binding response OmpR family regulator
MLRRLRENTSMRMIFYSAWSLELKKQLVGTGIEADDYIQIPVSRAELMARIARVITR